MHKMPRDLELEKQMDAYIKGKLSEKEAQDLWEKLLLRADYIELLETELGVKALMEEQSAGPSKADNSEVNESATIYTLKKSWKWIAAAASVAILVVAINFLQFDSGNTTSSWAVNNIDLSSNIASAPVFRSQKGDISAADSLLNRGFQAVISGDITKAIQLYDQIINQHADQPAAVQAYLNKGIIHYNNGEFETAITLFTRTAQKVKESAVTKEKAYWYMGNAYMQLEKFSEAREAIHTAYAMDGIYHQPAFRILKKLDRKLGNDDSEILNQ